VRPSSIPGPPELLAGRPDAVVDLRTAEGAALVGAQWRWIPVEVRAADFVEVGPDLGPSGPPNRTYDVAPHLSEIGESDGANLEPADLELRLGTGRVCFGWYRTSVTLPARVGDLDVTGSTVVFEIVVDDYAEVWVDGRLTPALGARGGAVVAGFNAPNRVVLTSAARPGQTFDIAVFAINGPISLAPANYIWVRTATLDLYAPESAASTEEVPVELAHAADGIGAIVPEPLRAERVAGGFAFTEGPVWTRDGALLFSSPNTNVIYRWSPVGTVEVFRAKSGYAGADIGRYAQPGSNGLTVDPQGRLVICQHGNRRVVRVEPRGNLTVLADRYQGRRLNSPNDVVVRADGTVFFTDPPFGLPGGADDPKRELPFSGVFAVRDGEVCLVSDDLAGPNGLAFSPDERFLYVGNWEEGRSVVLRYRVDAGGAATECEVFADLTVFDPEPGSDSIDGIKVDTRGHVYVCGPGGIWLFAPDGRRLGLLRLPECPHNLAWGDADARTLYVTAMTSVYQIRLNIPGVRP
jgi:gluconolactonase